MILGHLGQKSDQTLEPTNCLFSLFRDEIDVVLSRGTFVSFTIGSKIMLLLLDQAPIIPRRRLMVDWL